MNELYKTRAELLSELAELRQEVARLKVVESECLAKTEQGQAEESLRASEIRNRTLLQAIPDMIIRYRGDGTYLDIKPSKDFQAFGSPSELIGKNLFEVAPPEVARQRIHYIQLALQTGQVQTYEHSFMREGEARFEEIWVVPSGLADEAFVVVRDVTKRQRAEETLRQNEALLRTIIDTTPDWILVKDREHRFRLVNQSFADSVHLTPADLLGKTDLDLGIPEEVVKGNPEKGIRGFWADDLEVMNSGQTKFIAEEPIVVDGKAAFLSTVKSPLRDANGEVWGLLVFVHDITERKQAEEVLARRAAELQTVAQVGTATATILETDKLLQEVVDLTKRSFRLYHAHIYLLNEAGDTLVLAAGAGEVGRQMVAQGWSIPLERERSLVAQAARTRQGVVANDVRQAPGFLPNPLLPDTRAEMAVPLIRGEQLLGVLDVQAGVVDYFSAEDVQIHTILAGQIAVALQNARSFAEQQQTQLLLSDRVKELNCLNEISREIVESPPVPELLQWVTERIPPAMRYSALCQAAIEYEGQIYGRPRAIELPCQMTHALRIGGEVMGRIYISYTEKQEFLDEESALIGGIASRLSGYIESRRLLEQVQDALAAQEHLTVELDSQRRTLQAVLDNMPAGIFVAEAPSGKPLLANEQVKQLLGRGIALDVNKKETAEMYATYRYGTDTLYPPDQTPLARGLLGESITVDDMEVRRPNGRRTLLQVVGAPIRNAQGSVSASVAIFQDITERKQAEETLKESEERFRAIAETSPIPILISSISDGLILYGNEQLGRTFGLATAKLIGQQTPDFYYDPADRAPMLATFKRDGELHDYELHVKKADGTPFWVLVSMQPLVFAGQPAMLAAFYDVTERKQAEEALRRSQEQLSGALETAKLAYWEADMATMMFTFNDQFYSLLRTTAQQEGGYLMPVMQYAQKFVHPDDASAVGAEIQKSVETTDPNYSGWAEHRIIRADGSEGYFIVSFRVIKDEQGRTVKTIGANQDITERKQTEETLRQNEALLRTVIDSTPDWIFIKDQNHRYRLVNQSYANSMHLSPEEFVGKNDLEIGFPEEVVKGNAEKGIKGFWADDREVMDSGETKLIAEEPAMLDGQPAFLSTIKVPLRDAQNQVWGVLGFVQNITERKQAEEKLRDNEAGLSEALIIADLSNWEFDIARQEFIFNDQFYAMLHTTADQEGGYVMPAMQYVQKFVHPEDAYLIGAEIQQAMETTDPNYSAQIEYRLIRADGSEGYISVRYRVIQNEQGRTVKGIGVNQDITERKHAELERERLLTEVREALATADQFRQFVEASAQGIGWADLDGKVSYINSTLCRLFGEAKPEDVHGRPVTMYYPADVQQRLQAEIFPTVVREGSWTGELSIASKDGRLIPTLNTFFLVRDENGQPLYLANLLTDITERKQAELEQERLLAEVEAAYRQYVHREWEHFLSEQHQGAIRIEHQAIDNLALNIEPARLDAKLAELQDKVIDEGKTKVVAGVKANGHSTEPAIVAPIALRGQVIGTLSLQDLIPDRQWTADEVALVETVSEQLAQTLENLRLFEDTQKQATREQLTRQITDKLRAAADIDTIIQTGLTELAKALNVSRAYVKLTTKPEDD